MDAAKKAVTAPHVVEQAWKDTCELVFAPIYSRFSYTEGPAVDGSKYLSLLVSTCGRGRYVGKIVGASSSTWSERVVQLVSRRESNSKLPLLPNGSKARFVCYCISHLPPCLVLIFCAPGPARSLSLLHPARPLLVVVVDDVDDVVVVVMGARFDETFAAAAAAVVVFVVVEAPAPLRRLYGFYYYYYYPSSPDAAADDADDDYFSPLLISFCCFSSPVPPLLRSRGDCSRLNRSPPLYSFFPPLFSLLSSSSNDLNDAREREREREREKKRDDKVL